MVLQVVISFIVEAFVLQLEQAYHREQKKKLLGRDFTLSDDADCVEGTNSHTHTHTHTHAWSL